MTSPRWPMAVVFVVALAVYANTSANDFAMDDRYSVVENPRLRQSSVASLFTSAWGVGAGRAQDRQINARYYRPFTELSLWLDFRLFGLKPAGYHLVNAALHALISALVMWLLLFTMVIRAPDVVPKERRLRITAALFGGLLFAVHSVHSEVVNLVTYRAELLSALGYVTAIVLHLRFTPGRSSVDLLALPLLYAAALLSKESAVTLPGWLLLASLLTTREVGWKALMVRLAPLALVLAAYLLLRAELLGAAPGGMNFFAGLSPGLKALSVLKIFAHYVQLWFLPWPLTPFYDWTILPPATGLGDGLAWLGAAEVIGLVTLAVVLRRRAPLAALGIGAGLLPLIPVLHLVPLPVGAAERFLYIPSIGACLACAIGARPLLRRARRSVAVTLAITLVWLAGWTVSRNMHWRSDLTLQQRVIADYPHSYSGHYNLGKLHLEAGRPANAVVAFRQAEKILPGLLTTASWLAAAHIAANAPRAALEVIRRAERRHGQLPLLRARRLEAEKALQSLR